MYNTAYAGLQNPYRQCLQFESQQDLKGTMMKSAAYLDNRRTPIEALQYPERR